eukprot:CAMPEP_0202873546 /NCGR_PEP_ID=MMETSP1391-20130828/23446_1 /ASSEMBLY_ACC=CAM_ASM_000867 /TAXON_ID=1034604 /ORGANISM="Chlamydomonas leiostraca, Strain SAG 11-49" /LENGTH=266 /DNA_ID=CAMNT_0049554781 /DNA_START=464 /DNA_END=1265 /DNA_ORIENTATION=-
MIRTRKAASSTLVEVLTDGCRRVRASGHRCNTQLVHTVKDLLPPGKTEADLEEVWRTYTVFTTARNPFARAASGYNYVTAAWHNRTGTCAPPSFQQFCEQPMLLGAMVTHYSCRNVAEDSKNKKLFKTYVWDWIHVEPTSLCLVTPGEGVPVVDALVRSESLAADMEHLQALINAGRDPERPELVFDARRWANPGKAVQQTLGLNRSSLNQAVRQGNSSADEVLTSMHSKYADMFGKCGPGCVRACAAAFEDDINYMATRKAGRGM